MRNFTRESHIKRKQNTIKTGLKNVRIEVQTIVSKHA